MSIFARKNGIADEAYADAQSKLIKLRQLMAQITAKHGNQFFTSNRGRLNRAASSTALLYAVKQMAQHASISGANKNWETDFCNHAKNISKGIASDTEYLNKHENFSRTADSDVDDTGALAALLKQLIENACAQAKTKSTQDFQELVEWLQEFRTKFEDRAQTWDRRAQLASNENNDNLAEMARSRGEDYRRVLKIISDVKVN